MVRTLAILMLMTPAAVMAQEAEISPGRSMAGVLEAGDPTKAGRAYDDFRYSAAPGTRARAIARSDSVAVDVNVYFYDEYFDLLSLVTGGAEPDDTVEFTVPDAGSPTLVVIRVTTLADGSGPVFGAYTLELSEHRAP